MPIPSAGTRAWRAIAALLLAAALACGGCGAAKRPVDPFTIRGGDGPAAWSPDGTRIAFIRADANPQLRVCVVDTAGAAVQSVLEGPWSFLDWSPDGAHVALSAYAGIYTMRPNGDSLRLVTPRGFAPRWSPDGNELAFQTRDSLGVGTIWRVARDGSRPRALTPPPGESWDEPDWSADGTRLVHVRRTLGTGGAMDVFVMDTTGNAVQQLTTGSGDEYGPAWSPDGQWIAWSIGTFPPSNDLWIMKFDGTGARRLAQGGSPSWSPDSRRVVYEQLQYDIVRLFAIDIVTSRVTQLTR